MSKINWSVDALHSEVQFKVKHLVISTVTGHSSRSAAALLQKEISLKMLRSHLRLMSTVLIQASRDEMSI